MAGIPKFQTLAGKQSLEGQRWAHYPRYGVLAWVQVDPPLLRPSPARYAPIQAAHPPNRYPSEDPQSEEAGC